MSCVAIIPARGGSKRVPRKNIALIGEHPMVAYPIRAALQSNIFDDVIVSTEDEEIKEIAKAYGASVNERPEELATDTAFEIDVYKQVLSEQSVMPEHFCGIYPTAIFIEPSDLSDSYELLLTSPKPDVVMSVSRYSIHPFKALVENEEKYWKMVHPTECLMRSQTYPDYVASNGTFYWFQTKQFMENPSYYPEKLKTYVIAQSKGVDIDEPEDLEFARAMMSLKSQ